MKTKNGSIKRMEQYEPDKGIFYYFVDAAAACCYVLLLSCLSLHYGLVQRKKITTSETGRHKRANTCQSRMFCSCSCTVKMSVNRIKKINFDKDRKKSSENVNVYGQNFIF